MNSTLQKLLPAIEHWPEEDQEALAEAARESRRCELASIRCRLKKKLP
jgi:hypothetical protein